MTNLYSIIFSMCILFFSYFHAPAIQWNGMMERGDHARRQRFVLDIYDGIKYNPKTDPKPFFLLSVAVLFPWRSLKNLISIYIESDVRYFTLEWQGNISICMYLLCWDISDNSTGSNLYGLWFAYNWLYRSFGSVKLSI